jgi:hypothetical protein
MEQKDKPEGEKSVLEDKEKFVQDAGDEKMKHMGDKPSGEQPKPEDKSS